MNRPIMRAIIRGVVGAGILLAGFAVPVQAQRAAAMSVSPAVAEVSVGPGSSITQTVTIANGSAQTLSVLPAVGDVIPHGHGFRLQSSGSTADSAAAWVTVTPSQVDIAAGSSAIVTVSVRAPAGAPPGEHSAGVLFSAGDVQALHTLLITVTGAGLRRELSVDSIAMPTFETRGNVVFRLTVTNSGNTHAVLQGSIRVRDRLRKSDTNIAIPTLYAMPQRTTTYLIEWGNPPPILLAQARAVVSYRFESPSGPGGASGASTTGTVWVFWALALAVALLLLIVRLLFGLGSRRRKRTRRERAARIASASKPTTGADLLHAAPAVRSGRSAWEGEPLHTSAAGAIAVRRANAAIRLLKQGAGKSGVRPDVAIGLLRSVEDLPEVRRAVEAAYEEVMARNSIKEAAALSLALSVVESPHAPEALLRAYAKADRVLAARIRRALAQCDPADLRSLPDLLDALPQSRRDALPVG